MNPTIESNVDKQIEGSMQIALLNRIYKMNAISNATYVNLKKKFIEEYKIK